MNKNKSEYYHEVQQSSLAWIWLLLFAISTISFIVMIVNYDVNADYDISKKGLIIIGASISVIFLLVYWLFRNMYSEIKISSDGIEYKYPPFMNKFVLIEKHEIVNYKLRNYNPIKEYGGWGYRVGTKKNRKAYSVKGKQGLEIELSLGNTIMLGTQRKEALKYAMKKLMQD